MQTFREYLASPLTEKFFRSASPDGDDPTEYYVNPTVDEFKTAAGRPASSWNVPSRFADNLEGPCYYLGGLLTSKNLLIWDRNKSQHADAKRAVPEMSTHALPLYLYYFPSAKTVGMVISDFSKTVKHYNHQNLAWLKAAAKFRCFAPFSVVTYGENGGLEVLK